MNFKISIGVIFLLAITSLLPQPAVDANDTRPNVLFISIDDLNDWVGVFGGHAQVKTPNIDAFAESGAVIFQNAHCAGPVCGSSRSALLSGFMPSTTGVYGNSQNMLDSKLVQANATLPEYFSKHGYRTLSRGKIFHKHATAHGSDMGHWAFDHWEHAVGGTPVDQSKITSRNKNLIHGKPAPVSDHTSPGGTEFAWGPTSAGKEETKDYRTAQWAASQLQHQSEKPFFMAVGISRPHLPFFVPQEFIDLYDPANFKAPKIREDDLDDILVNGKHHAKHKPTPDYKWLKQNNLIDEAAMAYAAACSYADACLGVIFEGLEKSPHKDNTIVVIWGDHGWHLGEKLRYRKTTGWRVSTRVPLLVRIPHMTQGQDCPRLVNLIDIYPSLIELCGLPKKPTLDGRSFAPLLTDPTQIWNHSSLTIFGNGNASVFNERFHYMLYSDGTEEFYDLKSDPHEWSNLAKTLSPEQRNEKTQLAAIIPETFAPNIKTSKNKFKKSAKNLNLKIKSQRVLEKLK